MNREEWDAKWAEAGYKFGLPRHYFSEPSEDEKIIMQYYLKILETLEFMEGDAQLGLVLPESKYFKFELIGVTGEDNPVSV